MFSVRWTDGQSRRGGYVLFELSIFLRIQPIIKLKDSLLCPTKTSNSSSFIRPDSRTDAFASSSPRPVVFPGIWKRKTEQPRTNSRKLRIGRLAPVVLHRSISLGVALEWISRPHFFGHEGRSTVDERSMRRRTSRVARRTSRVADSRYNHRLQPRAGEAKRRAAAQSHWEWHDGRHCIIT